MTNRALNNQGHSIVHLFLAKYGSPFFKPMQRFNTIKQTNPIIYIQNKTNNSITTRTTYLQIKYRVRSNPYYNINATFRVVNHVTRVAVKWFKNNLHAYMLKPCNCLIWKTRYDLRTSTGSVLMRRMLSYHPLCMYCCFPPYATNAPWSTSCQHYRYRSSWYEYLPTAVAQAAADGSRASGE